MDIQLAVTSPSAAATLSVCSVFPPFFILILHTHFLLHSRRLNPRLLKAWQSWTVLCYSGMCLCVCVCAPWNRNLCSNPEFLFYLHGNAVPSSPCPTLLRIISHPFMKLCHAIHRVSVWKGSAPVNIMIMQVADFSWSLFSSGCICGMTEQYFMSLGVHWGHLSC